MTHVAEILFDPLARPQLPQCEAERVSPYYNDRVTTNKQCKHTGRFRIDGRHLCAKHAGMTALGILLEQSKGKSDGTTDHT